MRKDADSLRTRAKTSETTEHVSKCDLDIVEIPESWEKGGAKIGCTVGEYARTGKGRKEQERKKRGAGGAGSLVKEWMYDIKKVIEHTTFDEKILKRVPGERGTTKGGFLRKPILVARVKNKVNIYAEKLQRNTRR